jgi:hypothetical protein
VVRVFNGIAQKVQSCHFDYQRFGSLADPSSGLFVDPARDPKR